MIAMKTNGMQEYLSIPNLLGYLRIVLIPIYLVIYLQADSMADYYAAAGVMAVSFTSDFLDGKIARRFHMITDFGKILDPVADKLTQLALAASFAVRYPAVRILLGVFLIKESILAGWGLFMMRHNWNMNGAKMHGKICTALLDVTMLILLVFPNIEIMFVNGLVILCLIAMAVSLTLYMRMYHTAWQTVSARERA